MNRTTIINIILITVVGIFIVLGWLFIPGQPNDSAKKPIDQPGFSYDQPYYTNTPTAAPVAAQTNESVSSAFIRQLPPGDTTTVRNVSVVGDYALVVWNDDPTGGQTLLKYDALQKLWVIAASTGGAYSVAGLRNEGVPQKVVLALLGGLRQ